MKQEVNWNWYCKIANFNRRHWWNMAKYKGKKEEENQKEREQAAWYELLRRHPALEKPIRERDADVISGLKCRDIQNWKSEIHLRLSGIGKQPPPELTLINVLSVIGRTSWVLLLEDDKKAFVDALGKISFQKARSRKADVQVMVDPTSLSSLRDLSSYVRREAEDFADAMIQVSDGTLGIKHKRSFNPSKPNSFSKLYAAICSGKIVLVAELETDDQKKAAKQLGDAYLKVHKLANPDAPGSRTRWKDWLPIIAKFECSERQRRTRDLPLKANASERRAFQRLFDGIMLK